jgi:hypothetical protein
LSFDLGFNYVTVNVCQELQFLINTSYEVQRHYPFQYFEKTDLRFQISSSTATAAVVSVNIGGILVKNDGSL